MPPKAALTPKQQALERCLRCPELGAAKCAGKAHDLTSVLECTATEVADGLWDGFIPGNYDEFGPVTDDLAASKKLLEYVGKQIKLCVDNNPARKLTAIKTELFDKKKQLLVDGVPVTKPMLEAAFQLVKADNPLTEVKPADSTSLPAPTQLPPAKSSTAPEPSIASDPSPVTEDLSQDADSQGQDLISPPDPSGHTRFDLGTPCLRCTIAQPDHDCLALQPAGQDGSQMWTGFKNASRVVAGGQPGILYDDLQSCADLLHAMVQHRDKASGEVKVQAVQQAKQMNGGGNIQSITVNLMELCLGDTQHQRRTVTKQQLEHALCVVSGIQVPSESLAQIATVATDNGAGQRAVSRPGTASHPTHDATAGPSRVDANKLTSKMAGTSLHSKTAKSAQDIPNAAVPQWRLSQPTPYQNPQGTAFYDQNQKLFQAGSNNALGQALPQNKALSSDGSGKITVITNYVQVTQLPKTVFEYNIEFGKLVDEDGTVRAEGVKQRSQKKIIFRSLANMQPLAGRQDWATDFSTLWTLKTLDNSDDPVIDTAISVDQDINFAKFSGKPATIDNVTFVLKKKLDLHGVSALDPRKLLAQSDADGASVRITALNGLISGVVSKRSNVISAGANKFYAKDDHKPFLGIQAHRGYFSSVRPGTDHVLLNIGTMTGTFYQPLRVSRFIDQYCSDDVDFSDYGSTWEVRCSRLLAGREVNILYDRTQHLTPYNPNEDRNRHRVIAELGPAFPAGKMLQHQGRTMSVHKYFQDVLHARPVPSPDYYPLVNVGRKYRVTNAEDKGVYIPAEFLALDPDQRFARQLAPPHMAGLSPFALLRPAQTHAKIVSQGFHLLGISDPNAFRDLDVKVDPRLLEIAARIMPNPTVVYKDIQKRDTPVIVRGASWNMASGKGNVRFFSPGLSANSVQALDFRKNRGRNGNQGRLNLDVAQTLHNYGLTISDKTTPNHWLPPPNTLRDFLSNNITDTDLQSAIQEARKKTNSDLHLVILPDDNSDRYGMIKRVFDQHIGAHTVCITSSKVFKMSPQLLGNLALKFNAKLRGINHIVHRGKEFAFKAIQQDTMIVGADVSHGPSGMANAPSVAAVVASDHGSFAHFPGSMRLQAARQEFLQDLYGMMVERLLQYARKTFKLPTRIIFYRDGVGEDMYTQVRETELPEIERAYNYVRDSINSLKAQGKVAPHAVFGKQKLSLTCIIVGKRHNTRFFPKHPMHSDNNGNVVSGLLVDSVITRPVIAGDETTDFFLQSHAAIKGTARSAHYVVLTKGGLTMADIQSYTHALCFNFARATKGVSYAAPAYYADRLADRGTHYLKAYTKGRETSGPDIEMNESENALPKKDGLRTFEARVAQHIQDSPNWNPRREQPDQRALGDRINPWHPNLDDVMFWI